MKFKKEDTYHSYPGEIPNHTEEKTVLQECNWPWVTICI